MQLPAFRDRPPPEIAGAIADALDRPGLRRICRRGDAPPHAVDRSWFLTRVPYVQWLQAGYLEWWDGSAWRAAAPGDLIVTPAGGHATVRQIDPQSVMLRCTFDVDHRLLGHTIPQRTTSSNAHLDPDRLHACILPPAGPLAEKLLDRLFDAETAEDEALGYAHALWCDCLATCRSHPTSIALRDEDRWQQALDYLRRIHASNYVSRERVAMAIGVHPNHLSRLLRQHCGKGFAELLAEIRVEHAKQLIAAGERTLEEVGAACGFTSAAQFSRTFRRVTGVPPSRWPHEAD